MRATRTPGKGGSMLSLWRCLRRVDRRAIGANLLDLSGLLPESDPSSLLRRTFSGFPRNPRHPIEESIHCKCIGNEHWYPREVTVNLRNRQMTTVGHVEKSVEGNPETPTSSILPERIKVKRLDKTARHIMNILDKEAVDKVKADRDIPDIQAGCIVELKVEAPENKGRISTVRGLVIARKNAGISTTIRVRRLEANIGVDTIFPLYSPNIKAMKVIERRSVRRAKLYYVRDRPFNTALKELAQRTAKKRQVLLRGKRKGQSKK